MVQEVDDDVFVAFVLFLVLGPQGFEGSVREQLAHVAEVGSQCRQGFEEQVRFELGPVFASERCPEMDWDVVL